VIETSVLARHTLRIDDCDLSYLRGGDGPPLLYLHGSGGVLAVMPWMELLATSYDLIVPDHPGFGRTSTPEWFDSIHDLAFFYLDVLSALKLDRVHLVGHSLGGWLAAEIAIRNTTRLRTLALVAPAGVRVKGVETFDLFLASPEASVRAAYFDQALADRILATPPPEGDALDILLRNRLATARIAWQPRLYDPDLSKWLHRIDVPTLVLWGAQDGILPVGLMPGYTGAIPGAQSVVLENCGHVPHVERTDAFLDALNAFLQGAA
jgi:pimeloyl-ACP methyl ester carboxylesterase